jgi:hypothetical protein
MSDQSDQATSNQSDQATSNQSDQATCPYCREAVHAAATKCPHCQSAIPASAPDHHGTCLYCKETIHPEAVRCRYCLSDLMPVSGLGPFLPTAAGAVAPMGDVISSRIDGFSPSPVVFAAAADDDTIGPAGPGRMVCFWFHVYRCWPTPRGKACGYIPERICVPAGNVGVA